MTLVLCLASAPFATCAQAVSAACPGPPAVLASTQPNIFSEQQEQWLGDAIGDMLDSEYKPVQDPAQNEYLSHITQRLLAVLPPTTIQFRVLIVDSYDVNGFSFAGGRIYITRKLVANAKNEDEVAGVIGHEMGHILSHQIAIEMTTNFKRLLNVTSVTDKADIYAKFQRLVDASMKDKHRERSGESEERENEADTVSVYATAAAGYHPQSYSEFWDRMFFVDGKVGGKLSDFFGTTRPESKRLRSILKLVNALPPGCGATQVSDTPEFERWHTLVTANQAVAIEASAKPISEIALTPPLRMDLDRLRFSRDGKYILAQDESSISVFSRDTHEFLFRFDAEQALPAEFSPDSQHIVFHTPGLHTEDWSIADQKLVVSHEPLARHTCLESKLSPDGRTLFCVSFNQAEWEIDLTMIDVETGQVVFQKNSFFRPNFNFLVALTVNSLSRTPSDILVSSFSPDGNTLLIGPGGEKLAFDLRSRTPIHLNGGIENVINGSYAFLGNDKILGINIADNKNSGIFSFPDGKRLQNVTVGVHDLEPVSGGEYALTHSLNDYAVGLINVSEAKVVVESKTPSMDIWNDWLINENADGGILLCKLNDGTVPHVGLKLPLSPLGPGLRGALSTDGRLLALSTRSRSGVWDLATGERLILAHTFNSAAFDADNSLYAEFPTYSKQDRHISHITFSPFKSTDAPYKEDDSTKLDAGMLQEWRSAAKQKESVELIVHDVRDNSILWRRIFAEGEPAHSPNISGRQILFSFPLKTDFAKDRLKHEASLAAQGAVVKDKDLGRLIQIIDSATGNILH